MNTLQGDVCHAELRGQMTKTLRIYWTAKTSKLDALGVLTVVGRVKEQLYTAGVRYLKFPNDSGTYNMVDWTTGHVHTIEDPAPYYFR
jgi:hypothetical protein